MKKSESPFFINKMKDKCQNCGKKRELSKWLGKGSMMDAIHGGYEWWCELCMLEAQLRYAKERAKDIPKLERKIKKYHDNL